jgi:hypothetical protein
MLLYQIRLYQEDNGPERRTAKKRPSQKKRRLKRFVA